MCLYMCLFKCKLVLRYNILSWIFTGPRNAANILYQCSTDSPPVNNSLNCAQLLSVSTKARTAVQGSHIDIDSLLKGHIIANIIHAQGDPRLGKQRNVKLTSIFFVACVTTEVMGCVHNIRTRCFVRLKETWMSLFNTCRHADSLYFTVDWEQRTSC